jgi:hypothetical protein
MTLARWQNTIVDLKGNVQGGALITVRRENLGSPLVPIFTDRAGLLSQGNPFAATTEGLAAFYVAGGAYRITATKDGFSQTWRYVAIGRASESDFVNFGVGYLFDNDTSDSDPGTAFLRLDSDTLASVTTVYVSDVTDLEANVSTWLASFDDSGTSPNRGTLILQSRGGEAFWMGTVTGSVVDGTDYRKISVDYIGSAGSFLPSERVGIVFLPAGLDGADGIFTGTETQVAAAPGDLIPGQDVSDSNNPKRFAASTIGAGKQTIWMPVGAMYENDAGSNPAPEANVHSIAGSNLPVTISTRDFDATTPEYLYFMIPMPKGWNVGTITWKYVWSHGSTATNFGVLFQLDCDAFGNNDSLAVNGSSSGGTQVADTGGTTDKIYDSPESSAITIGNTPAAEDMLHFRVARVAGDVTFDTLAIDARLVGVYVYFNTNANTDD